MPRIIGTDRNELIINDPISNSQLGLYYRMPTTSERQGYMNAAVKRVKNKISLHQAEARMKYGAKILVGIRDGDFLRMEAGKAVPMSSNPASPDYYEFWQDEIESGCGDLVMALAAIVFDGGIDVATPEDEDAAGE